MTTKPGIYAEGVEQQSPGSRSEPGVWRGGRAETHTIAERSATMNYEKNFANVLSLGLGVTNDTTIIVTSELASITTTGMTS